MKSVIMIILSFLFINVFAATSGEVYAFLKSYRQRWDENPTECAKALVECRRGLKVGAACNEAVGRWFVDFASCPDVTETNSFIQTLRAKEVVISAYSQHPGVWRNTNAWNAVAHMLGRLRSIKDPRWIDKSMDVVTDRIDGVQITANGNPLLDFNLYRKGNPNAKFSAWKETVKRHQLREYAIQRMENELMRIMGEYYWHWGSRTLTEDEKKSCMSNIIKLARLTPKEIDDIFGGKKYERIPVPPL